ncbi:MAG: hypothetical protein GXO65_03635, partial [Euryarchaeota archaeon]|nr:hypothetical protein [Euryarchaeota archaeon]
MDREMRMTKTAGTKGVNPKSGSVLVLIALGLLAYGMSVDIAGSINGTGGSPEGIDPPGPRIINASVQPEKVTAGDLMVVTAEIEDDYGIEDVTADMGGIETINLDLISGSVYGGVWQGSWRVHGVEAKEYVTTITATNVLGDSASVNLNWSDPPVSNYYYNESESESTTTSTTMQDKVVLTFTPPAGDYLIIASAELRGTSTSSDTRAQVTVDGTVVGYLNAQPDETGTTHWHHHLATHKVVSLSGAEHTIRIQYSTEDPTATVGIKNARIAVLRVYENQSAETDSQQSLGTTYTDIVTKTFTVTTPGYYLVIGSAEYSPASTTSSVYANLSVDGISLGESLVEGEATTDYENYFTANVTYLSAGSHTIKIQGKSETGTMYMRRARVSAIRLTNYYDYETAADEGYTTNGATTWANKTVLSFTPSSTTNYLVIGTGLVGGDATNGANYNGYWDMEIDG